MCTLVFALNAHPLYPFIFAGNRDEFYARPTARAHWWPETDEHLLAGKDLLKGGTWTGINRHGKMAFITNYRDFSKQIKNSLSRGFLTRDFLKLDSNQDANSYLNAVDGNALFYDPFNLILGDLDGLYYYSNITRKRLRIESGVHGLSNALLDTPWPKVTFVKDGLKQLIENNQVTADHLFELMSNSQPALDEKLPDTGIDHALERTLSSIYIKAEGYGTRYQTVILIDQKRNVQYFERAFDEPKRFEAEFLLTRA